MSDVDLFANKISDKSYFRQKQERFEQRVLLKLLRGLEPEAGMAKRVRFSVGDDFDFVWLTRTFPMFPARLMSFKAPSTVSLTDLVKWPERTRVYKELDRAREDFEGEPVGVIFTSDGDGMQEMILHEMVNWRQDPSFWRICLAGDSMVIDPLDGFIASFKLASDWRLWDPNTQ